MLNWCVTLHTSIPHRSRRDMVAMIFITRLIPRWGSFAFISIQIFVSWSSLFTSSSSLSPLVWSLAQISQASSSLP
ncbi:hypothetical protein L218DRAFT_920618 [Marasmius fiardii PR-910]|nr:hypothetical protein L218DRAFT_920618 [Marasmius fiardii PR-910]